MRKATDQRDAQTISLLLLPFMLFHGGDVTCFDVMKLLAGRDEVMWLVVRWRGEYYWLVATCHVMSCHVMSCHVMRCDCMCCVMSRDAMRGDGDELLSVVPCNGTECYELKMPLVVRSCCVVWSGSVTMWWSKVLLCTTKYYNVLFQYYFVLQSTTPVLLRAAKYYSITTFV